jgi:hypothetical protein
MTVKLNLLTLGIQIQQTYKAGVFASFRVAVYQTASRSGDELAPIILRHGFRKSKVRFLSIHAKALSRSDTISTKYPGLSAYLSSNGGGSLTLSAMTQEAFLTLLLWTLPLASFQQPNTTGSSPIKQNFV